MKTIGKTLKTVTAVILFASMMLGMFPMSVFGQEDTVLLSGADVTEEQPEEDADSSYGDDFLGGTSVASVTADEITTEYEDFETALAAWNEAGSGSKLTLLSHIETQDTVMVSGDTSDAPMILDLNDHGIVYKGTEKNSVITVPEGKNLEITDDSDRHTAHYIGLDESYSVEHYWDDDSLDETEAADIIEQQMDSMEKLTLGGFIAGGSGTPGEDLYEEEEFRLYGGGIYNCGTVTMTGGTVIANTADFGGGACNAANTNAKLILNGGLVFSNLAVCDGGGIFVDDTGELIINEGEISYNRTYAETEYYVLNRGGGVFHTGPVTMSGGRIHGNSANRGGGIFACTDFENPETGLMISGGEISNNYADNDGGGIYNFGYFSLCGDAKILENIARCDGGGIVNWGELIMTDGEISYNFAVKGGGVCNTDAIYFMLKGGKIEENFAENGESIYNDSPFMMSGGVISGNENNSGNAFIHSDPGTLQIKGKIYASMQKNGQEAEERNETEFLENLDTYEYIRVVPDSADEPVARVLTPDGTSADYNDFLDAAEAWADKKNGATLTLLDDVGSVMPIMVFGGTKESPLVLDLNDHGITGSVFYVGERAHFMLTDNSSAKTVHYILTDEGIGTQVQDTLPEEGTSFIETRGGYLTGGCRKSEAGGCLKNSGEFIMNGGTICGNYASVGGGIYNSGTFVMNGGRIKNNVVSKGGSAYYQSMDGTVIFNGDIRAGVDPSGADARVIGADEKAENLNTYGYLCAYDISEALTFTHSPVMPVTYTGTAIKPAVKVYFEDRLLQEKKDYTIKYGKNTDAGTGTFTITGKGNYSGTETETFVITPKDLSAPDIVISGITDANFNSKKAYNPAPSISYGKKKLTRNKDFTVEYHVRKDENEEEEEEWEEEDDVGEVAEPKETGKYYAVITGKGNYCGSVNVPFEIHETEKVLISKLKIDKIPDQQYQGGEPVTVTPVIKNGSTPLTTEEYGVEYKNNTEIGTASVIITGKGKYAGSRTVTFKIVGIPMNKVSVTDFQTTRIYNGEAQTQNVTLSYKAGGNTTPVTYKTWEEYDAMDAAQKKDVGCIISYKNNKDAGTATMILTGINGCAGTLSKTFKITPFDVSKDPKAAEIFKVSLKNPPADSEYPYAKAGTKPDVTVEFKMKDEWIPLLEGADYTLSYSNNTAVNNGSDARKLPTVKVTGKGNFKGTDLTATFKIVGTKMESAGVKVMASDVVSPVKTTKWKTKKITVVDKNGKALKAGTDYKKNIVFYKGDETTPLADASELEPGDTIRVVVTGMGNYDGTAEGTYRIGKYDISKLTATVEPQIYTGKGVMLANADIKWKSVKKYPDMTTAMFEIDPESYKNNVNKGKATVEVIGKGDYCGRKKITYTIGAKGFFWWWNDLFN